MKKYLLISTLSLFAFTANAAEKEVEVGSTVKEATVYLQGAQLQRESNVSLSSGVTKLVFNDLEAGIYSNSIQVSGDGNFTIMDVQYLSKYIETGAKVNSIEIDRLKRKIEVLEDSILELNFELEEINALLATLNTEKNLLLNNPITKGGVGDSLTLLMDAVDYLRPQLNDVNKSIIGTKRSQHKINKTINKTNAKLTDLRNLLNQQNNNSRTTKLDYRVVVTVLAEQATKGKMIVKYYINNAGWSPVYDIRATDLDKPIRLSLKGQVYQNTGKNWEDVKLTISTKNAGENSQKPNLTAWQINLMNGNADYSLSYGRELSNTPMLLMDEKEISSVQSVNAGTKSKREDKAIVQNSSSFTTVQRQLISEEYEINLKYDIPSDGQRHMVVLKHDDLDAEFKYYAVPKADQYAYLMARIGNLGEVNILNAQANIYYSDTYIGQVTLNPAYFADTLAISMGKDKNVRVTRTLAGEKCKVKSLGSTAEKTTYYNYKVHNLNKRKIELVVEDNVPISTNGDIKIKILTENGGFKHTPNTGKIEWRFNLEPNEIKNFELGFEIKYPKDMQISGL